MDPRREVLERDEDGGTFPIGERDVLFKCPRAAVDAVECISAKAIPVLLGMHWINVSVHKLDPVEVEKVSNF